MVISFAKRLAGGFLFAELFWRGACCCQTIWLMAVWFMFNRLARSVCGATWRLLQRLAADCRCYRLVAHASAGRCRGGGGKPIRQTTMSKTVRAQTGQTGIWSVFGRYLTAWGIGAGCRGGEAMSQLPMAALPGKKQLGKRFAPVAFAKRWALAEAPELFLQSICGC